MDALLLAEDRLGAGMRKAIAGAALVRSEISHRKSEKPRENQFWRRKPSTRIEDNAAVEKIDAQLLGLLQEDAGLTTEALGRKVGLSATAVQRRIRRLRADGVIERDVAVLDPAKVGRPLTMLVMVSLERERADIIDRFKRAIARAPEIMQGFYVTGDTDFVLVLTAQDMKAYEAFTRQFFYQQPDIKNIKTLVVLDTVKRGLSIPLPEQAH